jgi:hypothetical protein
MIGPIDYIHTKIWHRHAHDIGNGYMDINELRPLNTPVDTTQETIQWHLNHPESEPLLVSLQGEVSHENVASESKNVNEADGINETCERRHQFYSTNGYGAEALSHTTASTQIQDPRQISSVSADTTSGCAPTRTHSAPCQVEPDDSRAPPRPPPPLPEFEPSAATASAAGLASNSAELRVLTWNIAAPNNNPFEFWASCAGLGETGGGEEGGGDGFARLMAAVQVRCAPPRRATRPVARSRPNCASPSPRAIARPIKCACARVTGAGPAGSSRSARSG